MPRIKENKKIITGYVFAETLFFSLTWDFYDATIAVGNGSLFSMTINSFLLRKQYAHSAANSTMGWVFFHAN
jgi:hypothetical protein